MDVLDNAGAGGGDGAARQVLHGIFVEIFSFGGMGLDLTACSVAELGEESQMVNRVRQSGAGRRDADPGFFPAMFQPRG